MLRQRLNDDLKAAMKSRDQRATSTLRLILAALKDRDIAARTRGITNGVDETEIIDLLQKMVRQRQESIALYKQGNRQELADQEQGEINIIERFLPKKMSEGETECRDRRGGGGAGRHHDQGHGPGHGGAERALCRPHGFRQGRAAGQAEAGLEPALCCRGDLSTGGSPYPQASDIPCLAMDR